MTCGHALCALVGDDDCAIASGVSRGCRTGPRVAAPFAPETIAEVSALLARLAPEAPDVAAATRLAFLFRREARADRSLLALATDGELEPALCARLEALCRRRA